MQCDTLFQVLLGARISKFDDKIADIRNLIRKNSADRKFKKIENKMPESTSFLCKTKADYNLKDVDLNKKEIKRLKLHDPGYFIGRSYFGDDE